MATKTISPSDPPPSVNNRAERETLFIPTSTPAPTKELPVGSTVLWGNYYVSNSTTKEPIEWRVLDVQGNKALLLSLYGIETRAYQIWGETVDWAGMSWEQSSLRDYLNNVFLKEAFSTKEQQAIFTTTLSNSGGNLRLDDGRVMKTISGPDTKDMIFILSVNDVLNYLPRAADRCALNTEYLLEKPNKNPKKNDVSVRPANAKKTQYGYWWLRDINQNYREGNEETRGFHVLPDGSIGTTGVLWYSYYVIRPAMWIDISYLNNNTNKK